MWESPVPEFEGLDMSQLGTDEAFLRVQQSGPGPSWLYHLDADCSRCPWQLLGLVTERPFRIQTHHTNSFLLRRDNNTRYITTAEAAEDPLTICSTSAELGEFGVYDLHEERSCAVTEALAPVNTNLALLVVFLVLALGCAAWWALNRAAGGAVTRAAQLLGWDKAEHGAADTGGKVRLRSLDTLRGIAITLMIFVNDGGGGYWFMEHATWNGLYVADIVFPWFIWIMGVCVPMSVRSAIRKETPVRAVVWAVTVRSVKLFLLGFILNTLGGWITLARLRVPGVLQRFAISYWVVFLVGYSLSPAPSSAPAKAAGRLADVLQLWRQWLALLLVLAAHQLVVYLVPAPGCGRGYAGPGGLHDWAPDHNNTGCIGGITGYIDKQFFTVAHIYGNPTAKAVYSASAFDPEGVWGSLATIWQVWLGYQAGYTLQVYPGHTARLGRWLAWAAATGSLGALLCLCSQDGGWVPVNKNLWSVSFVLVTSSLAFLLLAVLYTVIDVKKLWKGQPFFYAGMNSILLYCGHSVGYNLFPFHFVVGDMRTHAAKLPEAVWGVVLWLIIAFVLYRKRVFVTV